MQFGCLGSTFNNLFHVRASVLILIRCVFMCPKKPSNSPNAVVKTESVNLILATSLQKGTETDFFFLLFKQSYLCVTSAHVKQSRIWRDKPVWLLNKKLSISCNYSQGKFIYLALFIHGYPNSFAGQQRKNINKTSKAFRFCLTESLMSKPNVKACSNGNSRGKHIFKFFCQSSNYSFISDQTLKNRKPLLWFKSWLNKIHFPVLVRTLATEIGMSNSCLTYFFLQRQVKTWFNVLKKASQRFLCVFVLQKTVAVCDKHKAGSNSHWIAVEKRGLKTYSGSSGFTKKR